MKRITQKLMSVMLLSIFALLPQTMRGETVTKIWNFKNKATEIGTTSLTNSGVIASTNNGSNVYYPSELNDYLLGRFAFQYRSDAGKTNSWALESKRGGLWMYAPTNKNELFNIIDLKEGDIITITLSSGSIKFTSDCNVEGTVSVKGKPGAWSVLVSGEPYKVTADGPLCLEAQKGTKTNPHPSIEKIEITSEVSADACNDLPAISVVGAYNGNRTIHIKAPKTVLGNSTTVHYTTDNTEPTSSSNKYTVDFTVSTSDIIDGKVTIKAIAVKTDDNTVKSGVASLNVTDVGTTLSLGATNIFYTSITKNESGPYYSLTYNASNDNSDVLSNPTSTLSATFTPTGSTPTKVSLPYCATEDGVLKVVASAEGFGSSEASIDVTGKFIQIRNQQFDNIKLTDLNSSLGDGVWTITESSTGTRWANWTKKGGYCSDLTTGDSGKDDNYAYATVDKNFVVNKWLTVSNTQSGTFKYLAGFGFGSSSTRTSQLVSCAIKEATTEDIASYTYCINATETEVLIAGNATYTIPGCRALKSASLYRKARIEPVSLTVSSAGLATYTPSYNLDFSSASNITAYKAAVSGTAITLTKVTTVAAGEGVLLRGKAGEETTEAIAVATSATTANAGNEFVPVTGEIDQLAETDGDYTNFVLNKVDGVVGFYKANNTHVAAGKAYLKVLTSTLGTETGKSMKLVFDDETTGITEVSNAAKASDKAYYTLSGQRVNAPVKGLYLHNGKKVIIK